MNAKHTPGPWSLPHFARPEVNCQCTYILTDNLMGAVATIYCSGEGDDWQAHGDNPRFDEAVANAYLIAAAPDMREALYHAAACLKLLGADEAALQKIRAAIAKAEPRISDVQIKGAA